MILFALILLLLLGAPAAIAADPAEVPAGSSAEVLDASVREEAQERILERKPLEPPEVEVRRPAGEQKQVVRFLLLKVDFRGDNEIPTEDLQFIVDDYEGKEVTFEELKQLSQRVERKYREQGYLAVVFLPPQRIENGKVIFEVVISRMGELSVEGNRYFRKSKTRSYWRIPKGEMINVKTLNESLLDMNENPDRQVRPIIKAGDQTRTSDIVLQVQDRFPVHAGFSLDNQGVRLTGEDRKGFFVRHNNLLGLDDIFLIGTVFGGRFGAFYFNHLIPVNKYGTRLVYGFSHAQVNPKNEFERFGINGISDTYTLGVRQRLKRSPKLYIDSFLNLDFKEKKTEALSVTTVWDRLRVFSTGADIKIKDRTGLWIVNKTFSLSFSPHGDGFPLTSRLAESRFFKSRLKIRREQRMPWKTKAHVRFEAQLSPDKLPPQEQLFLGGATSVRGYPDSDYGADQALMLSFEYEVPLFFVPDEWQLPYVKQRVKDAIHLVGFLDYGYGRLRGPSATESRTRNLLGAGGGLKFQVGKYASARVEWARALHDGPLTESSRNQFHFRLQAQA